MVHEKVGMADPISIHDPPPFLRQFFLNIPLLNPIDIKWRLDQEIWVEQSLIIEPKLSI